MKVRSTVSRLGLGAGIGAGLGLMAAVWLGGHLTRPHHAAVGPPPVWLSAATVRLESDSGATLSGWFSPGEAGRGGVLLLHGLRSDRRQTLSRAEFLHRAGYALLLFDLQAHAESTGEHITFGHLEAQDAEAAFEELRARVPGEPIGVIGISLGGAAVVLGTVIERAQAVVLESVYTRFDEALGNRIALRLGAWARFLAPLLLWQVEPRLGVDPDSLAPIEAIGKAHAALLIVAGTHDQRTTLAQSRRLFERAPEPKSLWLVEGEGHEDYHRFSPSAYEQRVLEFFDRHLGSRGG